MQFTAGIAYPLVRACSNKLYKSSPVTTPAGTISLNDDIILLFMGFPMYRIIMSCGEIGLLSQYTQQRTQFITIYRYLCVLLFAFGAWYGQQRNGRYRTKDPYFRVISASPTNLTMKHTMTYVQLVWLLLRFRRWSIEPSAPRMTSTRPNIYS